MPVLGPWPRVAGLYVATGHYRNGIVLAPITAALMAETITTGRAPALLTPFLPDRFGG
jgi:glycine oxidase